MTNLRSKIIRLAHQQPALRPHLLPLLKTAYIDKEAATPMVVKNSRARNSTLVLTFSYDPIEGVSVTAKRDQVQHPEAFKKYKLLSDAIKKMGDAATGIGEGAVAQFGTWFDQSPYSDNSGVVVSTNDVALGKLFEVVIPKLFPITGGGVAGARGYRGSGWVSRGPNEWVWEDSSFGIGD